MRGKAAVAVLAVSLSVLGQVKLSVEQLDSFVRSSIKLGHADKRIAEYLKKVTLTQRLDESTAENLQAAGAGPRTMEALRDLIRASQALPAPPPKPRPEAAVKPPEIPPPPAEEQARVLEEVRKYARDYTRQLPNFICVQVTRRYYDPSGLEFWQRDSTITAQLTYFEQKEDYKILMVDNKATFNTPLDRLGGATSTGEFGSLLREIFEPESLAQFRWERWATLRGRRMHVFAYRVAQPQSKWTIRYQRTSEVRPGYRGLIYVDKDTAMVMRVTLEADDIPVSFPIQQASVTLDYDYAKIADREFLLPLKSTMRMREGKLLVKNETEFRLYRRFGAEAIIKSVDLEHLDPLPDSVTQEQPAPPAPPK